ncbi:hypothetical protein LTR09_007005 [Extremus antarcticus]|uniref:Uncharacterized protein n=1 Tax=Extremus antarcticus TaxID=702011 RepID=A0AAJ0G783_9PEZI|nr:hypothetical protein LTR09_007005 [Extremus antarcticus]
MPTTTQYLRIATTIFATIFVGMGISVFQDPSITLGFFELPYSAVAAQNQLISVLLAVYAVRDVFVGLAIYVAAYFGDKRTLGWMTIAAGAVAAGDGAICKVMVGKGEWNHWGYAPMLIVVGGALALG